jgi:hypothetical protein
MEEIEFVWNWNKSYLDIKIFKDNKLYGHIPKFVDQTVATINSKKYFLDTKLFQSNTFITDPLDNKAYCEIEGERMQGDLILKIKAPAFQYTCSSQQKLPFGQKTCIVTNDNKEILKLTIPSGLFPDSGLVHSFVYDTNIDLLIFCLFYFNTIPTGNNND